MKGQTLPESLQHSVGYLGADGIERVRQAYLAAAEAHDGVLRKSGDPYIVHPVAVAEVLADMHLDADAICAGLLHDTVEDTELTFEDVETQFGENVRKIVEGETKISKLAVRVYEDEQSENLRQMLLSMVGDVRIILVKLADRLHNMRTLDAMPAIKQQRIAKETLEIFAPLAHRLGISHIKNELEDLSFQYLEPERYGQLERQVRARHAERDRAVQHAIGLLQERLSREGLSFDLSGRSKHLHSIHRKMQRDNKSLDQIFDLTAIRAIIDPQRSDTDLDGEEAEKAVCYRALGIVHSLWTPIPGRFKDYVAVPKPNGYQSLHTTVIGMAGEPIEIQIRTRGMHEIAEFGVAAHWAYKEGIQDKDEVARRLTWMEQLLDADQDSETAGAFVDAVKHDLLGERVIVFTPAGDVINLPRGSTPIDFAYQVHTQVGHRCIGARVNGDIVPLGHELSTGDRVEVLTNRSSQYGPSQDWLNLAATRSTKQKIRQWFRQQERTTKVEQGRTMLERAFKRREIPVATGMNKSRLEKVSRELLNGEGTEDLFLAVANRRLAPKAVVDAAVPEAVRPSGTPEQPASPTVPRSKSIGGVYVDGMDAPANLAKCCGPVRGDDVVGYITRGRGISVHRFDCPNVRHLMHSEPERFVRVTWDTPSGELFPVDFEIIAIDRPGLLKDVLDVVAGMNKSATKVTADVYSPSEARIHVRVDVKDHREIEFIKETVSRIADVSRIYRSKPGMKA